MNNRIKQLGFTLIELTVAIGLVIILGATAIQYYDSSRTRAEVLYQKMTETAGGLLRMKTDASCFPAKLAGMINPMDAGDTFCGPQSSDSWKGPYTAIGNRYGQDAGNAKDLMLEQISPSLSVYLEERIISPNTNGTGPSNEKKAWILSTHGLTSDIRSHFLDLCSKTPAGAGVQPTSRCFAEDGNEVGYLVDSDAGWEQYYAAVIAPAVVADTCKGASCVVIAGPDVPVVEVDPCIQGGINVCPVKQYCPDGVTLMPANGICVPAIQKCPDDSLPINGKCPEYCLDGSLKPASGICPTKEYCPDGVTLMPANRICKPPCRVGIDAACTPHNPPPSTSGSYGGGSSNSSSGLGGYRGTDGQLYTDREQTDVCHDCNREIDKTDALKAAQGIEQTGAGLSGGGLLGALGSALAAVAGAVAGIIGGIVSWIASILSPPPAVGDDDSGGNDSGGNENGGSPPASGTGSGF